MPTEAFDATDPSRKGILKAGEWTLCIGAGVCHGIMPDWGAITQRMLECAYGAAVRLDEIELVRQNLGWSLDSLLQHALNIYVMSGRTSDEFNVDLAKELYGHILSVASSDGLDSDLCDLISNPYSRNASKVLELEKFLSSRFGSSSLMQVARFLHRAAKSDLRPSSVLTFNADVLLHTALTLLQIRESGSVNRSPDFHYRALYRSTDRANGKTPIYHIHGSITPKSANREAREKLVFPESSYSQLAASVYAWPQTVFLSAAQSTRMVFVGLSMSDPNIRRWLSWCDGYRRGEIALLGSAAPFSSQHLWITTRASDACVQHVKEAGLLHLGVRTAFIDSWSDLETALSSLAAL